MGSRSWRGALLVLPVALGLCGCQMSRVPGERIAELSYERAEEWELPEEVKSLVQEEWEEPFLFTFGDGDVLYIASGYGRQESDGFEIRVDTLYEAQEALVLHTTLLGPEPGEGTDSRPTYPYLVLRTKYSDKVVMEEL